MKNQEQFHVGQEVKCVDAVGTKRKLLGGCYYRVASVEPGGVRLQGYEGNLWAAERFRAVQQDETAGNKQAKATRKS